MKNILVLLCLIGVQFLYSQVDYSATWEDFYSYNNVKDIVKVDQKIYALCDNAVFIYDTNLKEISKLSSINGLSGTTTSAIYYSPIVKKLIIGYDNGGLEIVDENKKITIANNIISFGLAADKRINHITEFQGKLYISTSFAIVVFDLQKLEFGETFFIANNASMTKVNQIEIFQNMIYAATENGIYKAAVNNPNLIDFTQWTRFGTGNYVAIKQFNNEMFTSNSNVLSKITPSNTFVTAKILSTNIRQIQANDAFITVSTQRQAFVYNTGLTQVAAPLAVSNSNFYFDLNTAFVSDNNIYLGTKEFGILESQIQLPQNFTEIHPDGPNSNQVFSIEARNNHLYVVYGGYDTSYTPFLNQFGFSHFNGSRWKNIPYNVTYPARNLVHVTLDPNNENKAFLSSWHDGMLIVEDDIVKTHWNHLNSGLEKLDFPSDPNYISIRINGSAFDKQGNLWIANAWVDKRLKKYSSKGVWSSFDLSSLIQNPALGLNELVIDKNNTVWIGTRRNGVLAFNENGNKKKSLTTEQTKGSLPDLNVRTVAVDNNNRIWLGTLKGLVVYNNASGFFDAAIYDAEPIIIDDEGIPKRLMGEQTINSISIDGADNKWFGAENGGAIQTNPNGKKTLQLFNKDNSPLPSNKILKIKVDKVTGKVYFATDKGIVAFKSGVVPFGESLTEVYAFPNPVLNQHEFVTIDGRNGTHIPKGTNVKIVDAAGNLVYETNVVEGQELKGGKIVWNKTNLNGKKVASGVYIVLLYNEDTSETSSVKIAIIN
ncbi:MAG: two-component regulator propeller domain-containing protein [Flavobacteriaceae bacterium]|nr:two-component regulator propeller domain-containing protein [Flavobacteriaceae bacterium]